MLTTNVTKLGHGFAATLTRSDAEPEDNSVAFLFIDWYAPDETGRPERSIRIVAGVLGHGFDLRLKVGRRA